MSLLLLLCRLNRRLACIACHCGNSQWHHKLFQHVKTFRNFSLILCGVRVCVVALQLITWAFEISRILQIHATGDNYYDFQVIAVWMYVCKSISICDFEFPNKSFCECHTKTRCEVVPCTGVFRINCFKSSFPIIVCIIDDDDAELLFLCCCCCHGCRRVRVA